MNREAVRVALAPFIAFAVAAIVEMFVYYLIGGYPRWLRINGSNIPSAAVESINFPTIVFGSFLSSIVLGQFLANTLGGFVWSLFF